MDSAQADLRAFYEEEARQRIRKPLTGRRIDVREEFIDLMRREGRRTIIDFGAGPGRDGEAFASVGLDYVGVDLAHANGVLAAERGVCVVHGSIAAPPFRATCFDAGWSMSTLMHLPEADVVAAVTAMTAVLCAGAPLWIGVWGGDQGDIIGEFAIAGHRRLFSLRDVEVNRRLFAECAQVDDVTTWDLGPDEWQYQIFHLRVAG